MLPGYNQVSVQVEGTLGVGGNLRWEGSNNAAVPAGATYQPLSTPQGVALDIAAFGIKTSQDSAVAMRPRATAGDGTTNFTVTALFARVTR